MPPCRWNLPQTTLRPSKAPEHPQPPEPVQPPPPPTPLDRVRVQGINIPGEVNSKQSSPRRVSFSTHTIIEEDESGMDDTIIPPLYKMDPKSEPTNQAPILYRLRHWKGGHRNSSKISPNSQEMIKFSPRDSEQSQHTPNIQRDHSVFFGNSTIGCCQRTNGVHESTTLCSYLCPCDKL